MRFSIINFSVFISIWFSFTNVFANKTMTLEELFFDNSKPFHLKILQAIPEKGLVQIGPADAENTIIEFMDYFCGYCKKIHPELMELVETRDDTRVVYIQHPILSESSNFIASMVVAANFQNKGIELHNEIFSIEGSLNQEKLMQAIKKVGINEPKLSIDMGKDEVKNIVALSSFLSNGAGARGTPTLFVNEEFFGGYIPLQQIKSFLK
tara:strand:+ start:166 stop:792 length:627 start_codon:yes stop_codon:yes gene_type:complete